MPVGPFDHRKKRFRCRPCATSHLKCSGALPCSNCEKRGASCTYSNQKPAKAPILIDRGEQKTLASYGAPAAVVRRVQVNAGPRADPTLFYFYYFDIFLRKNSFSCQGKSSVDIKELMQRSTCGGYLKDAVLSLGAMEAVKLRSHDGPPHQETYRFALNSYMRSVAGLRDALEYHSHEPQLRHNVLWTTLLLGLFELMSDSTGQGWVQHIVHGTSKALVASGPHACHSSFGKRFFTEVKIFEVCRAIVFNEPTFLAQPKWRALSGKFQADLNGTEIHPLDDLLDIIVACSSLRVRVDDFIYKSQPTTHDLLTAEAQEISIEGFIHRATLSEWNTRNAQILLASPKVGVVDDFLLLAKIFFAATSIYLSGVFDYEITYWQNLEIPAATLAEDEIQGHVQTIIDMSKIVLDSSSVSPVLLLFPLRVAGARSWHTSQQECILKLLDKVEVTFSVAAAFKFQLGQLWTTFT
ncbi:hypothetical protein EDB81DRAFT_942388 [Dactylonectria macrodidyma]|uniref:Zn(2)-C6 fungal-type domain-containing protein n=1 Tax=Dactylonectria macrodidyma TaxID=307937 RepID=A0A9P9JM78_9HYPO|nr:hypothetical protein EDB81DRAFT_942388 [Dactylonectria macrodidyma]